MGLSRICISHTSAQIARDISVHVCVCVSAHCVVLFAKQSQRETERDFLQTSSSLLRNCSMRVVRASHTRTPGVERTDACVGVCVRVRDKETKRGKERGRESDCRIPDLHQQAISRQRACVVPQEKGRQEERERRGKITESEGTAS